MGKLLECRYCGHGFTYRPNKRHLYLRHVWKWHGDQAARDERGVESGPPCPPTPAREVQSVVCVPPSTTPEMEEWDFGPAPDYEVSLPPESPPRRVEAPQTREAPLHTNTVTPGSATDQCATQPATPEPSSAVTAHCVIAPQHSPARSVILSQQGSPDRVVVASPLATSSPAPSALARSSFSSTVYTTLPSDVSATDSHLICLETERYFTEPYSPPDPAPVYTPTPIPAYDPEQPALEPAGSVLLDSGLPPSMLEESPLTYAAWVNAQARQVASTHGPPQVQVTFRPNRITVEESTRTPDGRVYGLRRTHEFITAVVSPGRAPVKKEAV